MPLPERMLTYLRQALTLVRATPGRRGHRLDLQDCKDVVVAGDLHGHVPNFQAILKVADLANNPGRHLILQEVIHGTYRYPGGGDKSHQMVDLFAALKCQFPKTVHYLAGNHEMAQWTNRPVMKANEDLNALFEDGIRAAYGEAAAPAIYQAYLELFQSLPVAIFTPNRVLICHSLPSSRSLPMFDPTRLESDTYTDADLQPNGSVHSLLWGRDATADNASAFLAKMKADYLISGHIASETGFDIPNDRQIILDCAETPAGYILFPADRALTHPDLMRCVKTF